MSVKEKMLRERSVLIALAAVVVVSLASTGAAMEDNPFRAADYAALRKQLRAFYPDWGQGNRDVVKDPRSAESYGKIEKDLKAWCAAHPDYDALDVRRECYMAMRRHFVPFLFTESPFYFEAGVNGGWGGKRPARIVNKLCWKFYKEKGLVPDEAFETLSHRRRNNLVVICGPFVDDMHHVPPMRRILKLGFKGVRDEVAAALEKCPADDAKGRKELETALVGLETIRQIQLKFHEAAKAMGDTRMVEASARCPWEPPRTFYESLNTLWFVREIVGYVDGVNIFSLGRPDSWFIDAYRREIAAGTLTEAGARDLVAKFLITAHCHYDDMRMLDANNDQELEIHITLGGCDMEGKPVYNELTRMFLDAHIGCRCVYPKLHCRVAPDSPQPYLEHIGRMLCKGHAAFTLFNDKRFIKQFADEGFAVEDAREYIGCGCWTGLVDSMQDVDSSNYMNMAKVLALAIHDDPDVRRKCRLSMEPLDGARDMDELKEIVYRNHIRFFRDVIGDYTRYGRSSASVFPHPVYSMCMVGGVSSRRDTTDGGLTGRQRPREITLAFIGNVVDSLLSIEKVCFRDKVCSVREFLDAVRSNWSGEKGERLRMLAMDAPYWGDNSDASVSLMSWLIKRTHADIEGVKTDMGGSYKLGAFAYREFLYWGLKTKATPDGRHSGDRLAQGLSPSEFRCKEGVTAVMGALGRLPNECLYQSNANLTFDGSVMTPGLMAAVIRVFAKNGSHLLQPNCNSVEELLDAQKHPERHQDLIVRVCGFSARFVSLSKRWQDEVIARHRLR